MRGNQTILDDTFIQEWWTKIVNMYTRLEDLNYRVSKMDQMYPFTEMPEVSCDLAGDQNVHEAKSRCCKAPVFRDGDHLICNQCRLVTKPVEAQGD